MTTHFPSFRNVVHRTEKRLDRRTGSEEQKVKNHLFVVECGRSSFIVWFVFSPLFPSLGIDDFGLGEDNLEHVCGRPLGIRRFSNDELIVVQAYHGLFKLNVKTSKRVIRGGE